MLQRISDKAFKAILMVGLVLAAWLVVCLVPAEAQNFGQSFEDRDGYLTFQHESTLDSAIVVFSYPVDSNFYDTTKLLPHLTLSDDSNRARQWANDTGSVPVWAGFPQSDLYSYGCRTRCRR